MKNVAATALTVLCLSATPTFADWRFEVEIIPVASIQSNNMTIELQCDRIRFAPAGYKDSQDIVAKQGLSIRFSKSGTEEVGSFQAGPENAIISIVDNYPVEIVFSDTDSYDFVLDQIARNAVLNLSMIDQDVSYGLFDLTGSAKAINSLRSACQSNDSTNQGIPEVPQGVVYCGGDGIKRVIEYVILATATGDWNAQVTVNGEVHNAMTSYSYFGNAQPPKDFVVALLLEDRSEMFVFNKGTQNWLEFGDYAYRQCN